MAKRRTIAIFVVLVVIVAAVLLASRPFREFVCDPLFEETATKHYRTRADAKGEIENGWLPPLPDSIHDIRLKRNIDYGITVVQLSFTPQEFPRAFPAMTPLNAASARQAGPRWIVRRSEWIPAEIRTGRTDEMLLQGFQLYRLDKLVGHKSWYLLVHPQKGIAYGWSSNAG